MLHNIQFNYIWRVPKVTLARLEIIKSMKDSTLKTDNLHHTTNLGLYRWRYLPESYRNWCDVIKNKQTIQLDIKVEKYKRCGLVSSITWRSNTLATRSALMHNDGERRPSSIYNLLLLHDDLTSRVTSRRRYPGNGLFIGRPRLVASSTGINAQPPSWHEL